MNKTKDQILLHECTLKPLYVRVIGNMGTVSLNCLPLRFGIFCYQSTS